MDLANPSAILGARRLNRNFTADCDFGSSFLVPAFPSPLALPPARTKPIPIASITQQGTPGKAARGTVAIFFRRQGPAMPSSDQSKELHDASLPGADRPADWEPRVSAAVADMQERLAQFARQVDRLREGLPERQAGALGRIEQGITSLAERIAALGQPAEAAAGSTPARATSAQADEEGPWDPHSAEQLMRVCEMAQVELAGSPRPARAPERQGQGGGAAQPSATTMSNRAWLEARFADIAALLQRALAKADPARSLAALDRRLDQFEQRLEAALRAMASGSGQPGLGLVEAHIKELEGHFEATCRQLSRLDAMDSRLRELMETVERRPSRQETDADPLSDSAIAAMIDSAADRAVTRLAASLPASGSTSDAEAQRRIDALEELVRDYIAERRRGEDVTGGILHTIEDALTRIAERVDAVGPAKPVSPWVEEEIPDRDGIELESARLAEAYAAGARVLGREPAETSLDAANYMPTPPPLPSAAGTAQGAESALGSSAEPKTKPASDAQARQELRASAMRAKLKAQAAGEEGAADSAGLDEAKASMLGDRRAKPAARVGSHRFSLLLSAAMALLCGTGFLTVDSLLNAAPPPTTQQQKQATAPPPAEAKPSASIAPAASKAKADDPQPATEAAAPDPAPGPQETKAATEPAAQPAPARQEPDAVTDDPGEEPSAPTRRLSRIRTGSTSGPGEAATPAMLTPLDDAAGRSAGSGSRADDALPPNIGTASLRSAAAAGDALA